MIWRPIVWRLANDTRKLASIGHTGRREDLEDTRTAAATTLSKGGPPLKR